MYKSMENVMSPTELQIHLDDYCNRIFGEDWKWIWW
mgnify:CR=1 FL=1